MLVSIPEEVRITSLGPSLAEIWKDVSLELDEMEVSKEEKNLLDSRWATFTSARFRADDGEIHETPRCSS